MEENNINPVPRQEIQEGGEIDWMDILAKLVKNWKMIVLIVFIFSAIGVVSALRMQRHWGVTMTLAPELQNRAGNSLGSVALMRRMSGMNLTGATDAMDVSLFPEICASTPFLAALLDVPLTSYVSEKQKLEGKVPVETTVYNHFMGLDGLMKKKPGPIARLKASLRKKQHEKPYNGVEDPTELPRSAAAVVKALGKCISVNVDKNTCVTNITVVMNDPMMAKELADTVCRRLQEYVSEYRTRKAMADYEYYVVLADEAHAEMVKAQAAYAASVDYDRSVILQSAAAEKDRLRAEANLAGQIYASVAQQREQARAKIQEEKPVYAVIQPAVFPQHPIGSRKRRVLIWAFAGAVLACGWYGFGKDFFKKTRKDLKERMS